MRDLATDDQSDDRHARLEESEHHPSSHTQLSIDTRDPDGDRGGEIAQTEQQRNEHQRNHGASVRRGTLVGGLPPVAYQSRRGPAAIRSASIRYPVAEVAQGDKRGFAASEPPEPAAHSDRGKIAK